MPRFVTPLHATHRVRIEYTADGLAHSADYLCSATPAAVTPSGFKFVTFSGTNLEVDTGVQALATVLAAILPTTATIIGYSLQEYAAGSYNPVWANGIAASGGSSAARSVGNRLTLTYKDDLFILVKNVILGVAGGAPQKGSIASLGGVFAAYADALADITPGATGDWLTGRSAQRFRAKLNYVVSLDRKSRRRLGLV